MVTINNSYNSNQLMQLNARKNSQSRYSALSFGYDKEANDQLRQAAEQLKLTDIVELQQSCIKKEDEIRELEKTHEELEIRNRINTFMELKKVLAKLAEDHISGCNFAEKEAEVLLNEALEMKEKQSLLNPESDEGDNSSYQISWRAYLADELIKIALGPDRATDNDKTSQYIKNNTLPLIELISPSNNSPQGFKDIAGLNEIKSDMERNIINPLKNPETAEKNFNAYGNKTPRGYLLFGPKNCGKKSLVEALSAETDMPVYEIKMSKLVSPQHHQTLNNIKVAINEVVQIAKDSNTQIILLIDETNSFYPNDGDLQEMDPRFEMKKRIVNAFEISSDANIIPIFITEDPEIYKIVNKYSNNFDKKFVIDLPDLKTREEQVRLALKGRNKALSLLKNPDHIKQIAKATENYTNDDINLMINEAAEKAEKNKKKLTLEVVLQAIEESPILPKEDKKYIPIDKKKQPKEYTMDYFA